LEIAQQEGIPHVAEGSNMDDLGDYRPGFDAIRELQILSPLREVELSKAEIREYSKELGLPTASKPSFACLASRIPYGERITPEKLAKVEAAEDVLAGYGIPQYRVRVHGNLARIEVPEEYLGFVMEDARRKEILERFRTIGFFYVTVDMKGFRSGSMNEVLS
ncbi:MAG: TIGR00268 family protein, partial [Lachnospiraceae bacterium]|nr:TIGR00268 family protein [Lachnospiraceae bacterium]MBQ2316705.1 TIGR00268 family protein [Lachnospiraceae bacterium]MBQ2467450.1 TIGR00268 family protein [Lachnospiraceae bacterium]